MTHLVAIKGCLPGGRVEGIVHKLISYEQFIVEVSKHPKEAKKWFAKTWSPSKGAKDPLRVVAR